MKELTNWVNFITKPWVLFAYCFFIVISYCYIDTAVALYFPALHIKQNMPFISVVTNIGQAHYYVIFLAILIVFFRYIWKNKLMENRSWLLFLCVSFACCICIALKVLLGRARPDLLFSDNIFGFYGLHADRLYRSCPSGHVTTIFSLMLGCVVLWPRQRYLFLFVSFVVMITRVVLTEHYVSDVLFTFLLTLFEIYGLLWCLIRVPFDWSFKKCVN